MSIVPVKLDGVISDRGDSNQSRIRNLDESSFRAMALANRTWTIAAKITLRILADMVVIPGDAHYVARLDVINLSWKDSHNPDVKAPRARRRLHS